MQEYSELIRWVREAKAGNEEAFAYIYRDTCSLVYNIACTSLGDPERAKDIVSEVYIRVFRHLQQLREDSSFVQWLSVIAHHCCADYKRESADEEKAPLLARVLEDEVEEWHRREALHSTVQEVLSLLPESQQRAVQYVYFHQLSVGQAAALENCSIGTLKSRLYYARETLRRAITEEEMRSGDKLHMPVGLAALAGLMMLPKMPFSLSSAEAAMIFSSVMSALQLQYAAETGTAKSICLDRGTKSIFRRRYLLRFTAGSAAALIVSVSAVMLMVGALTAYAMTADFWGGMPDPSEDSVLAAVKEEETEPLLPVGTEVRTVTAHGAEICGTVTENGVRVHTVRCAAETLILPRDMEEVPVTEIAEGAFADGCDNVKYLHIGECLRTVSGKTVADLLRLQSIMVTESSPYLKSVHDVLYTKDGSVLIAFPQDKRITSFTVPDGVKTIGAYALRSRWLIKLTLPKDGLTTLEEYSLSGCVKITELRVPHSVSEIGRDALACPSLVTIYAAAGEEKHNWSWSGALLNYDKTHFVRYPAGKPAETYTLPSPILSVGAYAFSGADNLLEIIVPAAVKEIHAEAFVGCAQLQTITFRGEIPAVVGGDTLVLPTADCRIVQYTE